MIEIKKKIFTFYSIGAILVIIGAFLKIQHYPFANIFLLSGLTLEGIIFISAALKKNRENTEKKKKTIAILQGLAAVFIMIGGLFKIQHSPFANAFLFFALAMGTIAFFSSLADKEQNKTLWLLLDISGFLGIIIFIGTLIIDKDWQFRNLFFYTGLFLILPSFIIPLFKRQNENL